MLIKVQYTKTGKRKKSFADHQKSKKKSLLKFPMSLVWVYCAATRAMVISGPKLLQRAMSRSMALIQLGSVMMSMAIVSTGGVTRTMLC